jgi:hypothetical protein
VFEVVEYLRFLMDGAEVDISEVRRLPAIET